MSTHQDIIDDPGTSWGKRPDVRSNMRSWKIYLERLKKFESLSETLTLVFIILFFMSAYFVIYTTNFENIIFYDGTTAYCVLDGKTGEYFNAQ